MSPVRLIGIGVAVAGAVLLAFGLNAADAPANELAEAVTGQYTDRTMWQIAGGAAALVGGGLAALYGR